MIRCNPHVHVCVYVMYVQDKCNVLLLSVGSKQRNLHRLLCEAQLDLAEEMRLHLVMENCKKEAQQHNLTPEKPLCNTDPCLHVTVHVLHLNPANTLHLLNNILQKVSLNNGTDDFCQSAAPKYIFPLLELHMQRCRIFWNHQNTRDLLFS